MKTIIYIFSLGALLLLAASCGKTSVEIDSSTYQPKIVINALLEPGQTVQGIKLTRNFPVGETIDVNSCNLTSAVAMMRDESAQTDYPLTFDPQTESFYEATGSLRIGHNKTYSFTVQAEIDGKALQASAKTTTPGSGFSIDAAKSVPEFIHYRDFEIDGQPVLPTLVYNLTGGVGLYALSIQSLEGDSSTFITANPFGVKLEELEPQQLYEMRFSQAWDLFESRSSGQAELEIFWYQFWFYGNYQCVLYAGDRNYWHFIQTYDDVQDVDGNLRQPLMYIDGDGIGLFGSAARDTLNFRLLP